MKIVTVCGGGTGSFVVLSGLKSLPVDLGVVVTMMDSGGSTGRLRDQLGVLPPGDLRQCLVALSEAPTLWRELFLYRFENGDLAGHNFGNIFLSALQKVSKNYEEVLETVEYVLKTKGDVVPVTFEKTHLGARYESGKTIIGETNIDENSQDLTAISEAFLEPPVNPNPNAIARLQKSDYIIIGPGDLYTSIIPIFLTKRVREATMHSKAKIIFILNLMTKRGQTTSYKASHHVRDLTKYTGREPDVVVVNNGEIPQNILEWYRSYHERLVENDLLKRNFKGKIIEADLIDRRKIMKSVADKVTRSILRHDSFKLTEALSKLFEKI